jgi:hypothetical protein
MRMVYRLPSINSAALLLAIFMLAVPAFSQLPVSPPDTIKVDFTKTVIVSKSTPTLQVVVNPMLGRGSPIYGGTRTALKDLDADCVRYVRWNPFPKLCVAELEPPAIGKTSWDFSLIDPYTKDFLAAPAFRIGRVDAVHGKGRG